jgi:putative ABC transport system substrate-binding protein
MRRRDFISLVGGAAAAWPMAAQSQQVGAVKRVGVLLNYSESSAEGQQYIAAFRKALQALGWIEGRDVELILRWTGGDGALYAKHAAELAARSPDVVLAATAASVVALQQATASVPVVFVATIDPVGAGLVASMSRPGGRTTGFTLYEYAISGKWLELLKEIVPDMRWAAVLRDPAVASGIGQFAAVQTVAPAFGIELFTVDMHDTGAVERSIAALRRDSKGGLIVTASALGANKPGEIASIAERHRLPAVYPFRYFVEAGGLASYGPDLVDQYRRAAGYVDRILKGEKPADLPVQAPTKYELLINLKAAKTLTVALPPTLLARADQVIE